MELHGEQEIMGGGGRAAWVKLQGNKVEDKDAWAKADFNS